MLNEKLKGFRTLIIGVLATMIGSLDVIVALLNSVMSVIDVQLSQGGSVATLMAAAVSIKLLVTDAIPRIKGNLTK